MHSLMLRRRTTFSNAFKTGALKTMPRGTLLFNIFMNMGLYILYTVICFVLARPPHNLVKKAIASRLATLSIPRWLRHFITPRQMSKEQAVAVCFCGAAKTTGVGIPLVAAMWAGQSDMVRASIAIPVLLYTMEQVFLAQVLVYVFKWYLKRSAHSDLDMESHRDAESHRPSAAGLYELDGVGERTDTETGGEEVAERKTKEIKL